MKKTELDIRREKMEALREEGIEPYPSGYVVENTISEILAVTEEAPDSLTDEGPVFGVAGRLMAINKFGKSAFVRFKDRTGQMQAYIRKDQVDEQAFKVFKALHVGDFVGLKGTIFKTKTGEWTLAARELTLLCKSLRPLPEKYNKLKDPEKRYRQRYLDLIMNEETRETFIRRSKIVRAMRRFFDQRDFLEVETPMMQPIPGGAEACPFVTHHNALDMALYLRIAPELYLKRLVVGGLERVYEINRNFRNEGVSTRHNPEFTMLEFYWAYATYHDLMELTEEMFQHVAKEVLGSTTFMYQGQEISFEGPWKRISMFNALQTIGGADKEVLEDRDKLIAFAESKNVPIDKKARTGKIMTKLFDALVEPELVQPTFIHSYPVEVSPLSRRSQKEPDLTERFELFIAGKEIANGFSELNDPNDQRGRFLQQVADKEAGDEEAHWMDEDYVEALEYGMPPTAGQGVGIDRLAMLLTDAASIREVILFPHMRHAASLKTGDEAPNKKEG
ncbi:lysine--tRNA ligase [Desulfatibacillum aliphaticivorans]|uniref:lysine--tRNA ligase n=1 Tax=Desulfatibacillum aliphaticivorans TaxID=218208 RepID=UPI00041C1E7B|nr:lysine--tRNA ligase [Desulfatibacillum aliphaticivorans]